MIGILLSILPSCIACDEDALDRIELSLQRLVTLRQEIREGHVPTVEELSVARISRSRLLREMDLSRAHRFGLPLVNIRDRLLPAFDVELRMLSQWSTDPTKRGPSPVLTRLLEIERDMNDLAIAQLEQQGIANPLQSLGLLNSLVEAATSNVPPSAGLPKESVTATPPKARESPEIVESLIQAEAFYVAGFWERALTEYSSLSLPLDSAHLQVHYRMADCLLKLDRTTEAAEAFRLIADRFPETSIGKDANWNAELARTIALVFPNGSGGKNESP